MGLSSYKCQIIMKMKIFVLMVYNETPERGLDHLLDTVSCCCLHWPENIRHQTKHCDFNSDLVSC